ncbi:MAG: hypothetical protein V4565_03815 [Bacteroidota bacterium]
MRVLFLLAIVPILTLTFSSCRNTHAYEKYVKELDSLKVVMQQAVTNFKTIDSADCVKAYSKQYTYSQFLNSHLKDTVPKTVAENLLNFQSVENGLRDYMAIRSSLLNEAELSVDQLQSLSHDLKTGSIDEEDAVEFINEEKKQSEKIIEELKINTQMIRKHMELFYQSLPACESLVKQLNSGVLPALLNPEIKHSTITD